MLQSLGRFGATSQLESLPLTDGGLDAVRATLRKMAAIIRKYASDATTANFAREICLFAGVRDQRQSKRLCIVALQNWVRDHIAYFYDPRNTELLQTPPQTLHIGTGDCDDKTILLLAALESIGYETELLAVGGVGRGWSADPGNPADPSQPPPFSHVLGAVRFGPLTGKLPPFLDGWLTLETIVHGAAPGYKPPGVRVIMPFHI
jgi:transglutaminase-like putative cysteine protease